MERSWIPQWKTGKGKGRLQKLESSRRDPQDRLEKNFAVSNFSAQFRAVAGSNRLEKQTGKLNFSHEGEKASTRSTSLRRDIFVALYCRIRDLLKAVYRYPRHGCPSKWFRGYIWCGPARRNLSRETSKSRCNFMEAPESS